MGVVDSNRASLFATGAELTSAGYRPFRYRSVRTALSDLSFAQRDLAAFVVFERVDVAACVLNDGLRRIRRRGGCLPLVLVSSRDMDLIEGARFAAVVSDPRALLAALHWLICAGAPTSDLQPRTTGERVRMRLETRRHNRALLHYIRERAHELDERVDVVVREVPIGTEARVSGRGSTCRRTDPDPFLAVGNAFADLERTLDCEKARASARNFAPDAERDAEIRVARNLLVPRIRSSHESADRAAGGS